MKQGITWILCGIVGGAAGFLLTAGPHTDGGGEAAPENQRDRAASPAVGRSGVSTSAAPEERNFARLLELRKRETEEVRTIRAEIGRMDTGALPGLFEELLHAMEESPSPGMIHVLGLVSEELFRRQGEQAIEWAAELEGGLRQRALEAMLVASAKESTEVTARWFERLRKESYGNQWGHRIVAAALRAAGERSAEDLIEAIKAYPMTSDLFFIPHYAEGFDFAKMMANVPFGHGAREAFRYWAAKDKEAAWAAMKSQWEQGNKDFTLGLGPMLGGVVAGEGTDAALAWLAPRLDEIPPELRRDIMGNIIRQNSLLPEEYADLVRALPTKEDRLHFATSTFAAFGNINEVHAVLGAMDRPEQVEAILEGARGYGDFYQSVKNDVRDERAGEIADYFDRIIAAHSLGDEDRARALEALGR